MVRPWAEVDRIWPPVEAIDSTGFVGPLTGGSFFAGLCVAVWVARVCGRAGGVVRYVTAGLEVCEVDGGVLRGVDEPWYEETVL